MKATCHRGAKKHHTACASSENTTYMRFLNFRAKESICNLIKKYTFGIKHFISQNNVSWASSNTLKPFDVGGSGNSYLFSFSITFSPDIHACYQHVLLTVFPRISALPRLSAHVEFEIRNKRPPSNKRPLPSPLLKKLS